MVGFLFVLVNPYCCCSFACVEGWKYGKCGASLVSQFGANQSESIRLRRERLRYVVVDPGRGAAKIGTDQRSQNQMLLHCLKLFLVFYHGFALPQTLALHDDLPISCDGRNHYFQQTAALGRLPDLPLAETFRTLGELPILSLDGKLDEVKEMFQKVLEIREKTLGKEHVDTLATVDDLANVSMNQGNFTDAFMKYEWVAKAKANTLGIEHPATLTAFHNLAFAWSAQVRYCSTLPYSTLT